MSDAVRIEEVPAAVTYPLRRAVLRPDGRDLVWAGDEDPATVHLAARDEHGAVVGVLRLSPAPCPLPGVGGRVTARAPWQLRGMATDPAVRGAGAGRALLAHGIALVADRGGDLVWCDARTTAAGFYERFGFTVVTEAFEKPGIGPHVGMVFAVGRTPGRRAAAVPRVTPMGE